MSQAKKIGYSVTVASKQSCVPSKSKYNKEFNAQQSVEADNYFHTLADYCKSHNFSKPTEVTQQADGENYTVTLTTNLSHAS